MLLEHWELPFVGRSIWMMEVRRDAGMKNRGLMRGFRNDPQKEANPFLFGNQIYV